MRDTGKRAPCGRRAGLAAWAAFAAGAALAPALAGAAPLPACLAPASPFPHVIACEFTRETIAPGIERAGYRILTTAGPLHIALVIADPANPWVRFDTVLAHDALGGALETVTSMALRTGAVGGINGDYYAVGAGRAPLGLVVRSGEMLHAGGARPAFAIRRDGSVRIGPFDADGPLDDVVTAIGGGPVLLRNGTIADDSGSSNYADRAMRIPASVLVRFASRKIGLIVIDGRSPAASIGVNRPELYALLRALGAADALLLDSGGSATLVARVLGQEQPSIANAPSDGVQRPVADGFFVYSDAPLGPPAALVVRPARVTALAGVRVRLTSRLVDAAGHALGGAHGVWHVRGSDIARVDPSGVLQTGSRSGSGVLHLERDGVAAVVPVRVVRNVARLTIGPAHANPSSGQRLALTLGAWDARGTRVAVGEHVTWSARDARIDRHGRLDVRDRDALVTARVGRTTVSVRIPVGWHVVPFPVATASDRAPWEFATTPRGGLGATEPLSDGLRIRYDFSNGGRAAYARAVTPRTAGALLAVACDVTGDGNGEALRLAFVDRFGARESVTLAPAIDFTGVRRLSIGGLVGLTPPLALRDVYVVGTLATPAIRASGSVGVEHCTATLAGA
jgi:phosphodiester glycosidase